MDTANNITHLNAMHSPRASVRQQRRPLSVLTAAAAIVLFLLTAVPAGAVTRYSQVTSFGVPDAGTLGAVAVESTEGHIYVVDLTAETIHIFARNGSELPMLSGAATPAGSFAFSEPTSIVVDETGGPTASDLFVADTDHNVVDIFSPSGAYLGQLTGSNTPAGSFSHPSGLAFDTAGNLYVADHGHNVIDKFSIGSTQVTDSDFVDQITAPQINAPGAIAFDSSNDLYVTNYEEEFLKFDSNNNYVGTIGPAGRATDLMVDRSIGAIIFDRYDSIVVTNLTGEVEDEFSPYLSESFGLAENPTTRRLYVSKPGLIDVFKRVEHLPEATVEAASNITGNTAVLHGIVNPEQGGPTRCDFVISHETTVRSLPCEPPGYYSGSADQQVTAQATELEPDTTYRVTVSAGNEVGTVVSEAVEFTTPVAVHDLSTHGGTNVTESTATLTGAFEGNGEDTHYYFEWGPSPPSVLFGPRPHYGNFTPVRPGADAGEGTGTIKVSADLTGLLPATTYHFRLIAVNGVGATTGQDQEFTTLAAGPLAEVVASSVHSDSAELHARINPRGAETLYQLEFGEANCATNSCEGLSAGDAGREVGVKEISLGVQHLRPSTTYHFRLVAQNFYESMFGRYGTEDRQFNEPTGVAVDSGGNVWIADTGNNRIQEFDSGSYVRQAGGQGSGPGRLSRPNALATDSEGDVWVVDAGNHRVQEFNPEGEFELQFGTEGAGDGQFTSMHSIAVDPASRDLYVADASRIEEFNAKGEYLRQWGSPGTGDGQFEGLTGIAIDSERHVWTIEAGLSGVDKPRLQEFSAEGAYIAKFEFAEGKEGGQLSSPQGLAIDAKGNLWVADTSNNRIEEFNPKGEYVRQFGKEDFEFNFPEFSLPRGVAVDSDGNLWITDTQADRVQEFSAEGRTVSTSDQTFTTFPRLKPESESCPNAQVIQQTGAAQLLDCRAYELVSAASAGGYDVSSDLVPGQTPYEGYPQALSPTRVLYSVHNGAIPGTGTPTNFSQDPYVATRTSEGWKTEYVGFPAVGLTANGAPFGSPLAEADPSLDSFAFGGAGLCSPCFPDGSTGIPIRLRNGNLVQGMVGSLDPGPSAAPAGEVRKHFSVSAGGSHFVFGSTAKFEPDGNSNGDISIYDRAFKGGTAQDFKEGTTHVVSKTPTGATMTGSGIAELDISGDGTRILIGQKLGTDAHANSLSHLYMNVGDAGQTIDLTPGTTSGVLYDGMSSDGTRVYFTTADRLTSEDHDNSADIYRADVTPTGATLTLVSIGAAAGNSDSCTAESGWNGSRCDAAAIAGGAGVAAESGSLYFLSPEVLDTSGPSQPIQNEPNLYLVRPGSAPKFVAALAATDSVVAHALSEAATHSWGDFQVAPSGEVATFPSTRSLTGFNNNGFSEVFRYDAGSEHLDCVSCAPTNVIPTSNATLPSNGLGLTSDGRVFFTSGEALAPGDDNNEQTDAYEWESGRIDLISTGISPFDSGIYSVSADGTDVYFFTRETLVRTDLNGDLMKLYDARHLGGFLLYPPPVPCQASDECHGPSSQTPPPPNIGTYGGTGGNLSHEGKPKKCPFGKVRRGKRCVTRHVHPHSHRHRTGRHRRG